MVDLDESEKFPRLALVGKTGAGKSSLYNALVKGEYQRVGIRPTTEEVNSIRWKTGKHTTVLVDMKGLKESGAADAAKQAVIDQLAEAHLALIVVGYPDRAVEVEKRLIEQIIAVEPKMPVLVLGNRVDAVTRDFDSSSFNPQRRSTPQEEKIADWLDYLESELTEVGARDVIGCAAGESFEDEERQYNLRKVNDVIQKLLPEAAELDHVRRNRLIESKDETAKRIINGAAAAAASAAVVPIPVADAAIISSIQAGMIAALAGLYNLELTWSTAAGLATSAMAGVAGPMAVQQLVKFVPFAGSVIGPAFAGAVTLAVGHTFKTFFYEGNFDPSSKEIKRKVKEMYKRHKSRKDEFK